MNSHKIVSLKIFNIRVEYLFFIDYDCSSLLMPLRMELDSVLAVGMRDDNARIAQIGNNIANLSTPSYKRQLQLASQFNVQFDGALSGLSASPADPAQQSRTFLDPRGGALRATGRGNDVYVEGDAFLEVSGPNGSAYVRQASLRIDAQGRLVNESDFPVHTMSGEIYLPAKEFTITPAGDIVQDGQIVARLKVTAPTDLHSMQSVGNDLFQFASEMHQVDQARIKAGFSEGSNVESSQEMIQLLETVRHFESLQKVAQSYSDLHDKAAHYLGEF